MMKVFFNGGTSLTYYTMVTLIKRETHERFRINENAVEIKDDAA